MSRYQDAKEDEQGRLHARHVWNQVHGGGAKTGGGGLGLAVVGGILLWSWLGPVWAILIMSLLAVAAGYGLYCYFQSES